MPLKTESAILAKHDLLCSELLPLVQVFVRVSLLPCGQNCHSSLVIELSLLLIIWGHAHDNCAIRRHCLVHYL